MFVGCLCSIVAGPSLVARDLGSCGYMSLSLRYRFPWLFPAAAFLGEVSDLATVEALLGVFLVMAGGVEVHGACMVPCGCGLVPAAVAGVGSGSSSVRFLEAGSRPFEASLVESIVDKDSPFDVQVKVVGSGFLAELVFYVVS